MVFAALLAWLAGIMESAGYWGFFLVVTLENFLVPLPSEVVLPFAGYLASTGAFSLWGLVLIATLAALIGSLLSYALGYYGGMALVRTHGARFLLSPKHLDKAHRWYAKYGGVTVFVCRFLPAVRQISSIPAGAARMNIWLFSLYTVIGSFFWNLGLIYAGFWLGSSWVKVGAYFRYVDIIVAVLIVVGVIYVVRVHGKELKEAWRPKKKVAKDVSKKNKIAIIKKNKVVKKK